MHNIQATVLCLGWTTILIWIAVAWHKVTMVVMEKTTVTKWTTVACLKVSCNPSLYIFKAMMKSVDFFFLNSRK